MKKLLVFIFALFFSKIALADGMVVPLSILYGSNIFITGTFIPPCIWGLLLFWMVCSIEKMYFEKKQSPTKDFYKIVVKANIFSTLAGIPLTIGLFVLQANLCKFFSSYEGYRTYNCLAYGPLSVLSKGFSPCLRGVLWSMWILFNFFLFGVVSWLVEYNYLKEKWHRCDLKKQVAFANLLSYLGLLIPWGIVAMVILYLK